MPQGDAKVTELNAQKNDLNQKKSAVLQDLDRNIAQLNSAEKKTVEDLVSTK